MGTRRWFAAALTLVTLWSSAGVAQADFTVTGRVFDTNATPLPDLLVQAWNADNWSYLGAVRADAQGNYAILVTQRFHLRALDTTPGSRLVPRWFHHQRVTADSCFPDLTLERGFFVSGRAVDSAGNGLANILIQSWNAGGWKYIQGKRTDAQGCFTILVSSDFHLRAWDTRPGTRHVPRWYQHQRLDSDTSFGEVSLQQGFFIEGVVSDEASNPLGNILVQAWNGIDWCYT